MIDEVLLQNGDEMARVRARPAAARGVRSTKKTPAKTLDADVHQIVVRAKREWESTVDALKKVVCLLAPSSRIVRANRVVERWGLCKVGEAIGRTPHELLHPGCGVARCALAAGIRRAWKGICEGEPSEFEHLDTGTKVVWHVAFRPFGPDTVAARSRKAAQAVLVVSDVSELYWARDGLEKFSASLESRVRTRTRELADANRDLRNEVARRETAERAQRMSLNELGRMSEELITAQEHERRRIAVELHDSVGQSLTAVKYSLERVMAMLRQAGVEEAHSVVGLALDGVQQAAGSIRAIAMNLRPTVLDDMGAASAVKWFCRQFAEIYPTFLVSTGVSVSDSAIPDRLETTVFRCAQELLNNVAKHSRATEVSVDLWRDGLQLLLEVRDNGVGMQDSKLDVTRAGGHGIRNLRERAEMTGGQLSIGFASPSGTVARIRWYLMNDEADKQEAK
ncbi:MAG: histidine kinase [Gammaproteobacteria bacterium]|nr:histidine kinase [Gammaproteobacteria bacterium]